MTFQEYLLVYLLGFFISVTASTIFGDETYDADAVVGLNIIWPFFWIIVGYFAWRNAVIAIGQKISAFREKHKEQ